MRWICSQMDAYLQGTPRRPRHVRSEFGESGIWTGSAGLESRSSKRNEQAGTARANWSEQVGLQNKAGSDKTTMPIFHACRTISADFKWTLSRLKRTCWQQPGAAGRGHGSPAPQGSAERERAAAIIYKSASGGKYFKRISSFTLIPTPILLYPQETIEGYTNSDSFWNHRDPDLSNFDCKQTRKNA